MDRNFPLEYWKDVSGPFPQLVFSDNARGLFSLGVKVRTRGFYGHFMYLIGPDELASQWLYFKRFSLDHFAGCYMKFVDSPYWTDQDRGNLLAAIRSDLSLPWYRTLYDWPGIIGELFGWDRINLPGFYFCSERGAYLRMVEPGYNEASPTPARLNEWTKESGRFAVTGRYCPE